MQKEALEEILRDLEVYSFEESETSDGKIAMRAACPFAPYTHKKGTDRNPSFFTFADDEGVSGFICHSCHKKGRISSLARMLGRYRDDMQRHSMIALAADKAEYKIIVSDWDNPKRKRRDKPIQPIEYNVHRLAYLDITDPEARPAQQYLAKRGIKKRTAQKLGLQYDEQSNRVLFPVFDTNDNFYGYTGRFAGSKLPKLPDGRDRPKVKDYAGLPKKSLMLGAHLWEHGKPLLLVEGLFGYAHLHQIGADAEFNIGAVMGSVMTKQKAEIVLAYNESVYLLFDNDEAGELGIFGDSKHSGAVSYLHNNVPLYIPVWPEGKADPDELTLEEVKEFKHTIPYSD